MYTNKKIKFFVILIIVSALLFLQSCKNSDETPINQDGDYIDDNNDNDGNGNIDDDSDKDVTEIQDTSKPGFDLSVFEDAEPIEKIQMDIPSSDDGGVSHSSQMYTLYFYQDDADFSDYYPEAEFQRKDFDIEKYNSFILSKVYKNYLYFHVIDKDGTNRVFRYDMESGKEETIFTYNTENTISIYALNDKYIIWKEDENANWWRVSLYYYDIEKGTSEKIFKYTRDERDFNAWNFSEIILDNNHVYFDDIAGKENGKSIINLYHYDIETKELEMIGEKRAAEPMLYKGISWLSYDDEKGEYLLYNKDSGEVIPLGSEYTYNASSENIIAGKTKIINKESMVYFDGEKTYPILQSTNNIDSMSCTDDYIAWDGWSRADPLYFDIKNKKIISVDCLEKNLEYMGVAGDEYLVFEAHKYIPDPKSPESGSVITKTMIYYFIKTSELHPAEEV